MGKGNGSCCCCGGHGHGKCHQGHEDGTVTLNELPVGATATIVKVLSNTRGQKKFADVGLVAGQELLMEAHAPFGGLIRVKVMETSMALHRDDAAGIVLKPESGE